MINASQILLPNDYQRNIDYIQWKKGFVWGEKIYSFSKISLKREHSSLTEKKGLLRDNLESVKTRTKMHKHGIFIFKVHLKKKKIYFDCCQCILPFFKKRLLYRQILIMNFFRRRCIYSPYHNFSL